MSSICADFPRIPWLISFGDDLLLDWVVDWTHDSGMPIEAPRMRPERDFGGTPYNHTWVPPKSIVEHFRALLRDFCFWAIFRFSESKKILIFDALERIKRKRGDWTPQPNRLKWSSRMGLE